MKVTSLMWGLLGALAVATLLAIGVGLASVGTLRAVTREQGELLRERAERLSEVQRLQLLSERRARYSRTVMLTGEERAWRALRLAREEWKVQFSRLEGLLAAEEARELLGLIHARQRTIEERVDRFIAMRDAGLPEEEVHARIEAEIVPLRERLDESLTRLVAREEMLLQEAIDRQEVTRLHAITRLGLATLAAVLISGLFGGMVVRSLQQHRESQAAVRQSESRFQATFNQAAVGLAHVGLDGRFLLLNERYSQIVGYRSEELLGRSFEEITHPEDVEGDRRIIRRLLAGESLSSSREKRYLRKDGSVVWVNVTVSIVRDEAGASRYFVAVAEDITRRKALEEERALLLAETREALVLREEFLSVASHELRTPLTPLRLKLQLLLREARESGDSSPLAGRVVERVETGLHQVQRLTRLIDGLLEASYLGKGKLTLALALEEVDLSALVREMAKRFALVAVRAGCALEVEAEAPVVGRWDRRRLEQVVGSLISNALKFGAGHPVRLSVEREGEQAWLVVRDEGIGIAPEELPRIFGRFSRGVSDRHYGGLGLGLFLTRYVVESLGGEVTAESVPGQGATFRVRLPLRGPEMARGKPGDGASRVEHSPSA
jgi:PAS domain S-box-containing protein